jgi:hypothetical protein
VLLRKLNVFKDTNEPKKIQTLKLDGFKEYFPKKGKKRNVKQG